MVSRPPDSIDKDVVRSFDMRRSIKILLSRRIVPKEGRWSSSFEHSGGLGESAQRRCAYEMGFAAHWMPTWIGDWVVCCHIQQWGKDIFNLSLWIPFSINGCSL